MSYTKMVKGATKIKMAPPKAKYVDPILHGLRNQKFFNEIVTCLQDRLNMNVWTIVYKSLIVIHLMIDTETIAMDFFSHNLQFFQLNKIMNSNKWSTNDIVALRRYNDYLKGKCYEYGELMDQLDQLDVTHHHDKDLYQLKKLIEVESMERQIKLLIKNKYSPQDLQNDLLFYAIKILIQDLLVLYNKLNEGIISLLESFFDLSYENEERTLNDYKSFVQLTDYVVKYLKIGKAMGLDIPVIKHITTKLIQSLEDHLATQQQGNNKKKLKEETQDDSRIVSTTSQTNNNNNTNDTTKKAEEHLQRIREQKQLLERQLQQQQQVMITPTLPTNFTGTNPFTPSPVIANTTDSFTFEQQQQQQQQPLSATSTSNPFLVQSPVTTGFYATNQNVVPSYTGSGFGGYSSQPQVTMLPPPSPQPQPQAQAQAQVAIPVQSGILQQQPYHITGNTITGNNNPFALSSIMEEPSMVSTLDPQQQQMQGQTQEGAITGITYLPVQVTQYAVVGSNPFEQTQPQQQAQAQAQAQQRNSNLIDM